MSTKYIIIGKLGKPYGILGWIHIISYTEKIDNIFKYQPWFLKNENNQYIPINFQKCIKKKKIIYFKNINNRTKTENFIQKKIYIQKKQLPKNKSEEYYWNDIINCKIYTQKKKFIGIVIQISSGKIYDHLIIKKNKKYDIIFIPFILKKIIKNVNIEKKKIIIKWKF